MKYKVVRKRRKSIRGFVKNGEIVIKAPHFVPDFVIESYFQKYRDYFARQLRPEYIYYLGVRYEIGRIDAGYRLEDGVFYSDEHLERNIEAFLLQKAKEYLVPRAYELARRFGEEFHSLKISKAKSRWGSCSSKKSINLSYRLMMLPPHLIDYVIIHELCHLVHMDHSKRFWKLVECRCPDYVQREAELKELAKYL